MLFSVLWWCVSCAVCCVMRDMVHGVCCDVYCCDVNDSLTSLHQPTRLLQHKLTPSFLRSSVFLPSSFRLSSVLD